MSTLQFTVLGLPVTQGSMRAFIPKGWTRPIVTHDQPRELGAWRGAVAASAQRAARKAKWTGVTALPVALHLTFRLLAPKARPKTIRTERQAAEWLFPIRHPDLDKLVRPVLDALTGVLLRDDAQVVALNVRKVYDEQAKMDVELAVLVGGTTSAARPAKRELPAAE